jgi:phosphate butyryltransferase
MSIHTFAQLLEAALERGSKRVAIVGGGQRQTLHAVRMARALGLADCILFDDPVRLTSIAKEQDIDLRGLEIVDEADMVQAAFRAVEMIHTEEADLLMNGRALPVELMEAALDREKGLRIGKLISDVSILEIPDFDRLIFVSDVAIVVSPTLAQKVRIVQNAIDTAIELGIKGCCSGRHRDGQPRYARQHGRRQPVQDVRTRPDPGWHCGWPSSHRQRHIPQGGPDEGH